MWLSLSVAGLNFTDRDLDASELGGEVVWQIPEEPQLARYMVYLVTAGNRIPLSAALAAETSSLLVGPDLAAGVELAVYTKSSLFEQTTPATVEVVDLEATVSDVVFEDLDLDESHLGGVLNFSAPADTAEVTGYSVFFADADSSAIEVRRRVPVTPDLAPEELGALIPADIEKGNFSHVLVYTKSALVEQSTPAFGVLNDTEASVENVAFEDEDLDEGDLGGTVYWTPRGDVTAIQDYLLYVDGKLMGSAPFGMNQLNISADFRPVVQELAIYTRSRIYESSTPQVHNFSDTAASVSGIRFDDEDLDKFELTGSITWSPPPDEQVTFFRVYFASSSSGVGGSGRLQLSEQPAAVTVAYIPNNFQTVGYSHILVYTGSVLAEQTTPEALEFVDDALEVANLSFPDQDLDAQEVGGYVSWDTPNFTATVSHYAVYLSVDVFGTNRSKVGDDIPLGTNTALVPAETPLADWKYVAVYMKSPGAEQTTPASLLISDSALQAADVHLLDLDLDPQDTSLRATISRSALAEQSTPAAAELNDTQVPIEVNFTDQDLDENDLGGLVTWTVAGDWELASGYTLYLAAKADGTARSQVDISPATRRSSIFPANIPKEVADGRILSNACLALFGNVVLIARGGRSERAMSGEVRPQPQRLRTSVVDAEEADSERADSRRTEERADSPASGHARPLNRFLQSVQHDPALFKQWIYAQRKAAARAMDKEDLCLWQTRSTCSSEPVWRPFWLSGLSCRYN
ncbi:unnamed protein product [Effrenium voratum]|nr:unnamed protein product [Effrenium voratum]